MSLYERIHGERRQTDITPLHERRGDGRRSTPRWIKRKIEREFEGKPGLPIQDDTFDVLGRAA